MTDNPPEGYRQCVGVALFNADGLVFIGDRAAGGPEHTMGPYSWQMPQGGIDKGETPYQAALRELAEETSVTSVSLLAEAPGWLTYDLPEEVAGKAWKGRYRGQTQKWFALRFEGTDAEIDVLSPAGGHKAEFTGWRWERLSRTPELIIPFKRNVYDRLTELFAEFAA